jgi:hypothetical protein
MAEKFTRSVARFGISRELDEALDALAETSELARVQIVRAALTAHLRDAGFALFDEPSTASSGRRRHKEYR